MKQRKTQLQNFMNEKYNFRNGSLNDLVQLQQLGLRSYGQFKTVLPEEGWKKMEMNCGSAGTYIELFKIAQCFVCETDDQIIGMAFLIPSGNPFAFFASDWAYIRLVGVDPRHEGRGVGKKLTQKCIDVARKSGEKTLALHTSEFQNAARHIYESLGFIKLRDLDPIYEKKYFLYTLKLDQENAVTYHKAGLGDLQNLIEMRIAFAIELTGVHPPESITALSERLKVYFKKVIRNNTAIFYLARSNNQVVGIGGLVIREQPSNFINPSGKVGYLLNMYTVPSFRRKGICAEILNLLVEEANKTGIKAFELHATKEGELVYKQHGFKIHDEPTYRKYL
jgi:GNAT superfamily N-acetyltransferase